MGLFELILVIALAGLLVWGVLQIPMPPAFQKAIQVIAIIGLVLYVLQGFGLITHFHDIKLK